MHYYLYNLPSWIQWLPPTLCRWFGHRPAPVWTEALAPGQGVVMTCLRCEAGLGRLPAYCEPEDVECYRDDDGRVAYRALPARAAELARYAAVVLLCLALPLPALAEPDAGTTRPATEAEATETPTAKEKRKDREAHERLWCPDSEYLGWNRRHDMPICAPIGIKG